MKNMFKYLLLAGFAIAAGIAQAAPVDDDGEGPDVGTPEWHHCQARGGCNYN